MYCTFCYLAYDLSSSLLCVCGCGLLLDCFLVCQAVVSVIGLMGVLPHADNKKLDWIIIVLLLILFFRSTSCPWDKVKTITYSSIINGGEIAFLVIMKKFSLPTEKTPTPVYEQQWAPNTIQTIIIICNAKGIPNAIAQKL